MLYEHQSEPLLPWGKFVRRFLVHFGYAFLFILLSLFIGMTGYHFFEGFGLVDSFLDASMILAGMGPVGQLKTTGGKIFAGCYAIYSGIAFLSTVAVIFSPVVHRFLHSIHLKSVKTTKDETGKS